MRVGPYAVQRELGRGGMATVYLAQDTRDGQIVALKVLLPFFAGDRLNRRRFLQESANARALVHPNIVRVLEAGEEEGILYFAMEYADGSTLADLLKANPSQPLSPERAIPILQQIAAALDYAHIRDIVHRDVKPANILLMQDGRALLSDFGVARPIASDHTIVAAADLQPGTPAYMSPEQAQGGFALTGAADIYSLGVAAYAMLTGKLPFEAPSALTTLHKVIHEPPFAPEAANPVLPRGLAFALRKVLAKDPAVRYPTAGDFVEALERGRTWVPKEREWSALQRQVVQPPVAPPPGAHPADAWARPGHRRRRAFAAVLVLFLLLGGAAWLTAGAPGSGLRVPSALLVGYWLPAWSLAATSATPALVPASPNPEKPNQATTEMPTEAPTEMPTETPTSTPTETPTSTPTETPAPTATESATPTATDPPTATPNGAATATAEAQAISAQVAATLAALASRTPTAAPTYLPTATPSSSATPTATATVTGTPTPTQTPLRRPTSTPQPPTATRTSTPLPTRTPTRRATSTPAGTPTPDELARTRLTMTAVAVQLTRFAATPTPDLAATLAALNAELTRLAPTPTPDLVATLNALNAELTRLAPTPTPDLVATLDALNAELTRLAPIPAR